MSATISVCIPTHGRPEMLKRAIASAQDADEVLVYENDDGAPGPSITRAIHEATGDYLLVLDDDDWLLPGWRERILLCGDIGFSDMYIADPCGTIRGVWSYADRPTDPHGLVRWTLANRSSAIPMFGPFRRAWLREHGLEFISWESTGYADDCRTLLEWMRHDPVCFYDPGPYRVYTIHDGQFSNALSEREKFLVELERYSSKGEL